MKFSIVVPAAFAAVAQAAPRPPGDPDTSVAYRGCEGPPNGFRPEDCLFFCKTNVIRVRCGCRMSMGVYKCDVVSHGVTALSVVVKTLTRRVRN